MSRLWQIIQTVLGLMIRHPVTGTSILPILPDGRIVLIQRRDNSLWALPGGIVDWGEDVTTAVKRELKEETGLEVVEICRLVGVYSAPDRDPRMHSICIAVEAKVAGAIAIQDKNEVLSVRAFALDSLPMSKLAHDHERQLRDYLQDLTTLA